MDAIIIENISNIEPAAQAFLARFESPKIIAFYGEMGAGKTTFIQAICKVLNVVDTVSSPTFAIINEYQTVQKETIFHFDLYRLEDTKDLIEIGFEDYLYSNSWCFIEWPEIAEQILSQEIVKVRIDTIEKEKRKITFLK